MLQSAQLNISGDRATTARPYVQSQQSTAFNALKEIPLSHTHLALTNESPNL